MALVVDTNHGTIVRKEWTGVGGQTQVELHDGLIKTPATIDLSCLNTTAGGYVEVPGYCSFIDDTTGALTTTATAPIGIYDGFGQGNDNQQLFLHNAVDAHGHPGNWLRLTPDYDNGKCSIDLRLEFAGVGVGTGVQAQAPPGTYVDEDLGQIFVLPANMRPSVDTMFAAHLVTATVTRAVRVQVLHAGGIHLIWDDSAGAAGGSTAGDVTTLTASWKIAPQ